MKLMKTYHFCVRKVLLSNFLIWLITLIVQLLLFRKFYRFRPSPHTFFKYEQHNHFWFYCSEIVLPLLQKGRHNIRSYLLSIPWLNLTNFHQKNDSSFCRFFFAETFSSFCKFFDLHKQYKIQHPVSETIMKLFCF